MPNSSTVAGFVYVMGPLEGCVKIGQSGDPQARRQTIGKLPVDLPILVTVQTARPRWLESYLHRAFADRRVRGEWFNLTAGEYGELSVLERADTADDLPDWLVALHESNTRRRGETAKATQADQAITTWKVRQRTAKTLRLLGAYLDLKQEDVIELFADDFDARLAELQEQERLERDATKGKG